MSPFVSGVGIGLAIAAPVGPIGVLCIRRALAAGAGSAFATGLGAALADACYGAVAAFGLTVVSSILLAWQTVLAAVGGLMLLVLGVRTGLAEPAGAPAAAGSGSLARQFGETFLLTLSNPATILSFLAVFASLGAVGSGPGDAAAMVLGVFVGSALWWLTLSMVVARLRARITRSAMRWINRIAGCTLVAFGLGAMAAALRAG